MYIDTHAHLYLEQFNSDIDQVISDSLSADVQKIFLPNIDSSTIDTLNKLHNDYPDQCLPLMGLHPCSVKGDYQSQLEVAHSWIEKKKYYGIGETGIDLHWDTTYKNEQIIAFEIQIEWAIQYELPIIIHSRKSLDLTIDIIARNKDERLSGIFHCFNGTIEQAKKIIDSNFYMGMGGVTTYKNAGLDDVIGFIPLEWMVLETDAPYLSPVPYRGKRNESSYIPIISKRISAIKGIDNKEVELCTTNNALKVFKMED